MSSENAKIDDNEKPVAMAITDDANQYRKMLRIDDTTKGLKVMLVGGGGTGTVTSITAGTGLTATAVNPIVSSGMIALDSKLAPLDTLGTAGQSVRVNAGATALEYYTPSSTGITIGTTNITSGTNTRILYDNSGVVGEYTLTGSGTVVAMATSPTFQTSINGAYLTASQILITDGSSNIVSAPVATYPSLTELSYVKGVTSAIQTQINGKQASGSYATGTGTANGTNTGDQTLTIAGTTSPTIALSGSNTATFAGATGITLGQTGGTITITGPSLSGYALVGQTMYIGSTAVAINRTTGALALTGITSIDGNAATVTNGVYTGANQTLTGQNKFNNLIDVNNAITASGNAATVPVTYRLNTVTNNSAATLTITMTTTSAVDGQMTIVRIYDFSGVAQTLTLVNTENSSVTAPASTNGSTTLPLTLGFMFNNATTKWRLIASA
jgi:hypothetical protein